MITDNNGMANNWDNMDVMGIFYFCVDFVFSTSILYIVFAGPVQSSFWAPK